MLHLDLPKTTQDYIDKCSLVKPLTREEETRLTTQIKSGNPKVAKSATNKLIKANLLFVVAVARNYENQNVSLDDLIQAGNIGLINAAKHFDASKNFKFISYAVWWVRQAIFSEIAATSRVCKVGTHVNVAMGKLNRAIGEYESKYHNKPTVQELSKATKLSVEFISGLLSIGGTPASLNQKFEGAQDDKDYDFLDYYIDEERESPEDLIINGDTRKKLLGIVSTLPYRRRLIIEMYYGLYNDYSYTLEEIGQKFGVTREDIRLLRKKTLDMLRVRLKRIRF
jgi:RNA polymerase primary sigma factor